jgi:hypothetical protein
MRGTEMPGISAFLRVGDEVIHTYSTYGRGIVEFHNGYRLAVPRCACLTNTTPDMWARYAVLRELG